MRIGEEVFAVVARKRWGDPLNREENGPDAGNRRWPNDVICALAECAVRVSGTVRVEMHELDGGAKNEQKREEGYEQNARQRTRRPYSVAQDHD